MMQVRKCKFFPICSGNDQSLQPQPDGVRVRNMPAVRVPVVLGQDGDSPSVPAVSHSQTKCSSSRHSPGKKAHDNRFSKQCNTVIKILKSAMVSQRSTVWRVYLIGIIYCKYRRRQKVRMFTYIA
jgi:hypothetical protein